METLFEIGEVVKTHGLKGRIKLKSFLAEPRKVLARTEEVYLRSKNGERGPLRIMKWDVYRGGIFLEISGVDGVEVAESLIGCRVLIPVKNLEELPEGEYYWQELIGMTMVTEDGEVVGTLTSIFPTKGNDVYVCSGARGEILVPAIGDVILRIDTVQRKIVIRFLEGMDGTC